MVPPSPDGSCPCTCNYITDVGCECRDLQAPLRLSVAKTQVFQCLLTLLELRHDFPSKVWGGFPMQYLNSFNFKPYEAIVRPNNNQCSDTGNNPTCGWYYVGSYQVTIDSPIH